MLGIADNRKAKSLASKYRQRRIEAFMDLLGVTENTRILDIGGTSAFWRPAGFHGNIVLLNRQKPAGDTKDSFIHVQGDARDLSQFGDGAFDVVFSNSVIEHVGDAVDQQVMAHEVSRVGRSYFIQVPNRHFPIEPHFLFPYFQFLPVSFRRCVARYWPWSWYEAGSPAAMRDAETIRLLGLSELSRLFPDAHIIGEKFGLLNKSLIAVRGLRKDPQLAGFRVLVVPHSQEGATPC